MLEELETELDFLTWDITSDESWFFKYNPETKRRSEEWYTPVSKTEESSHEQIKNQYNSHHFFDSHGAVHKEIVPPCGGGMR